MSLSDQSAAFAAMLGAQQQLQPYASPSPYALARPSSSFDMLRHIDQTLGRAGGDLDALVELSALGRALLAEYREQTIPVPKWLPANLARLSREIGCRWKAKREEQLRAAEKDLEELRSKEEKRAAKEMEIAQLRKELGL